MCADHPRVPTSANAWVTAILVDTVRSNRVRTATRQVMSRSVGYIAILAMTVAALFVVTMDVLKYGFGIGPPEVKKKKKTTTRKARTYLRFVYVNNSVPPTPDVVT